MKRKSRIVVFFLVIMIFAGIIGATTQGVAKNIQLGLDLKGGFEILYDVIPPEGQAVDNDVLLATVRSLEKRINVLGVSEPRIDIEGDNRIRVQLAGVTDQAKAREILSTEANLTFRDVNDKVLMTGADLKEGGASQSFNETNQPNIIVQFKDAKKFQQTSEHILDLAPENVLVIWLDFEEGVDSYKASIQLDEPKYLSAASVNQVFTQDSVSIEGNFTVEEAKQLADLLNAGSLPVELHEVYSTSVAAQFGEQSLEKTIFAGVIGVAFIFLFMLFVYRLPGLISVVSLSVYIYLVLLIFDWMNAVLTLPGVAALILGVGMAVDSNIITFERIKDELRLGKSVISAFRAGNKRSLATILDANLTTLIAAGVLYYFGTSAVKGFATMLIVSTLLVFLTNVFLTRLLLGLLVQSRILNGKIGWFAVKKKDVLGLDFKGTMPTPYDRFDFVSMGKKFCMIIVAVLVIGIGWLAIFKLNLGIDFVSGSRFEMITESTVTKEQIEKDFAGYEQELVDISINGDGHVTARFKDEFSKEDIEQLKQYFTDKYGSDPNISTVSPEVGKQLVKNAIVSAIIASIGIIIYIAFRFEFFFGIGAIASLIHDALFIIIFFSVFKIEVDVTFIAAVLTIIGYSVNDTIVTFDRIRENLARTPKVRGYEDLKIIVNDSLRQTLTRSLNTIITVLVAAVSLWIFGSEAIRNFSLALVIGLVAGTFSSLFVAAQIWLWLKTRQLKKKGPQINPETNV
ncbi:MAG TPA: protein translocase subunit SecDF [Firmicutes bacterium]|nr:protein translocase subunit SecDF [Bacillales bacterium]HJA40165.1 protein translocase subunit SecDF [Bacillota bacterium]